MQTPIALDLANESAGEALNGINLIDSIETVISSLDLDKTAMVSHGANGHLWKFQYGTVEVFVQLTGTTDEDMFTVWSRVLTLPAKDEAKLARRLLELNWTTTFEARFAIADSHVILMTTRTVADLSPGEVSRAITVVATIADENDEPLLAEFGMNS